MVPKALHELSEARGPLLGQVMLQAPFFFYGRQEGLVRFASWLLLGADCRAMGS